MVSKTADFTLAALANIPTTSEKGCLVHVGKADGSDGYSLGVGNTSFDDLGNNLIFESCPNQWKVLRPIGGTGWHHLAAVVDGSGNVTGAVDGMVGGLDAKSYVALQRGVFLVFNMATFTGAEFADTATPNNTFNPTGLDIQQWVNTVKDFGASYAVLTIRHVDGFCLFPTTTTDHGIAYSSWYAAHGNPDITQIFFDACHVAGILPFIYYAISDGYWTNAHSGYTYAQYKAYLEGQLTEILTRYRPAAIWLDAAELFFSDARPWASATERNNFIKGVLPGIVVLDNSHNYNLVDSDVVVYEDIIPPSTNTDPMELSYPITGSSSWFWKSDTQPIQDAFTSSGRITYVNSLNGSILVSVPPNSTGVIPAQFVKNLMQIRWFRDEVPRVSPNNMTGNSAPAPYVASASSEYPSFEAYRAFNSPANQVWTSNQGSLPAWIQIDLGAARTVSDYMVQSRTDGTYSQWLAWSLSGSNNGTSWTAVDIQSLTAGVGAGIPQFFTLSAPQTYRYWRWTITGSVSGTDADCSNLGLFP